MRKSEFKIRELPSADARNQLRNSIEKMDGVKHVSVHGDTVKVDYARPATDDNILDHIRSSGNKLR